MKRQVKLNMHIMFESVPTLTLTLTLFTNKKLSCRTTLRVIEYSAKSFKVTQGHLK